MDCLAYSAGSLIGGLPKICRASASRTGGNIKKPSARGASTILSAAIPTNEPFESLNTLGSAGVVY